METGIDPRVVQYLDTHREEHFAEFAAWIAQPSVSATGEGYPAATEYAVDLVRRSGLDARVVQTAGRPAVIGHAEGPAGAPRVLIYGHYDVQPPGPLAEWASPPFELTMRDGRAYGRGTGDNKGQHLAHLLALRAIHDVRGSFPCTVTVLLDGEEEIGSPHLPDVIREYAAAPDGGAVADLAIWSDGPVHESGQYAVMLGVRGIVAFELRVRGAAYSMHSGNWGGVAPNPAWELVWLLNTMRDPDGRVLVEGFYDDVEPLSQGEKDAIAALPDDTANLLAGVGLSRMDRPDGVPLHERLTRPTFSINSLTCEDAGEHRTVIPNVAVAKCDMRLVANQRPERVAELVASHVEKVAPHVEFRVTHGGMWPSRTLPETPYTDAVRAGAAAGLGVEPLVVPALGGSLPLYVFTDLLGLPSYGIPIANVDEANHAPNENLELYRFYDGIRASVGVLDQLGSLPKG